MLARQWAKEYGSHAGHPILGGVAIVRGTGVGQTRRVLGLLPDNRTFVLDRPFGVSPDPDSMLVLFHETTHSATVRDNTLIGIPEHVDRPPGLPNTASTTLVPLWGRADRVLFRGNTAVHMRTTLYSQVGGNLSVTDHVVSDTVVTHTRDGLAL